MFPTIYQNFIHKSRYARFLSGEKRREDWNETVDRYIKFFVEYIAETFKVDLTVGNLDKTLRASIYNLEVMPSMRALMTAGPALARDHIAAYNCSYIPFDSPRAFDEEMYILMNGTGVGFSVEQEHVGKLPRVAESFFDSNTTIIVDDSRIGWSKSFRELISLLYAGQVPKWDLSRVRPAGSVLKTFGGRASGPEPLGNLFDYCVRIFKGAAGRQLTSLEVHDVACMIANIVVVGGVRRSALISLSDLDNYLLRQAKSGDWYNTNLHRRLANNSAVYNGTPPIGVFMEEWKSLYESKSGERGIFNRAAVNFVAENANKFRQEVFDGKARLREINYLFGTNPCSEIILREHEFCNLTSVQVRPEDNIDSLLKKVTIATILGTLQSTLTNFRYISKKWKNNCEDERLLGVSLNGIFDNELLNGFEGPITLSRTLRELKKRAIETNIEWAFKLGINASAAITCNKPDGTTSALNNTASGFHPRHSEYYIRNVRNDMKDPLTRFMIDAGVPSEMDLGDTTGSTVVFKFPIKSPDGAVTRKELTAINHLELWRIYQLNWCEHKPSVSISVKENEWLKVGDWVYENFDLVSGVSFFPWSDHIYKQAPFQECSRPEYESLLAESPQSINWSDLRFYEDYDQTTGAQTLACSSPESCEI